mgnify:CR=1 FL=1
MVYTVQGGYFQSEFRPGEDRICPDSYEKKNTEFRDEYMTFFTPDALVGSLGIDFSRRMFFFSGRKFLGRVLKPSGFPDFQATPPKIM